MQQQQQQKTADVVIVGAGIAGLTAADHLRRNGVMDVVILEASNRFLQFFFFILPCCIFRLEPVLELHGLRLYPPRSEFSHVLI